MTLEEVRERVERIVRENLTEREATPHPNSLAVPTERHKAAERLRVLGEYHASIGSGMTTVLKQSGRAVAEQAGLTLATQCLADLRAAAAASDARSEVHGAYRLGESWMLGKVGGERPGAVVAWAAEHQVKRILPVPVCEEQLAQARADVAVAMDALLAHLDAWDRQRTVTADVTLDLPNVEVHATGSVR